MRIVLLQTLTSSEMIQLWMKTTLWPKTPLTFKTTKLYKKKVFLMNHLKKNSVLRVKRLSIKIDTCMTLRTKILKSPEILISRISLKINKLWNCFWSTFHRVSKLFMLMISTRFYKKSYEICLKIWNTSKKIYLKMSLSEKYQLTEKQ